VTVKSGDLIRVKTAFFRMAWDETGDARPFPSKTQSYYASPEDLGIRVNYKTFRDKYTGPNNGLLVDFEPLAWHGEAIVLYPVKAQYAGKIKSSWHEGTSFTRAPGVLYLAEVLALDPQGEALGSTLVDLKGSPVISSHP
jgi:hypothetical protein